MWGAVAKLFLGIFTRLGAVFMIKRSGAKAQELKSAKKSLERSREANEIDENASTLDQKGIDAEVLVALEVPHWAKAARAAGAALTLGRKPRPEVKEKALLGVQAPECNRIGVFGEWVRDTDNAGFRGCVDPRADARKESGSDRGRVETQPAGGLVLRALLRT